MLTLWKGPPISLEFPSPSTNGILQSHLKRGKIEIHQWENMHLHWKSQNKSRITRKQICFLLFDALAFVPKRLKHLFFPWSLKISVIFVILEHSLSSRKQPQHKGRKKKKKGKRKIWGKFYLNIPSSFPSFPEVFHSQAFQCNCRSVWADHFEDNGKSWSLLNSICCFCNTDFFICFDQINWGFWPSLSSLLKGHWHNCLPYQRLCWLSTQVPINPPRAVTSIPHHPPYYFLFQN